MSVQRTFQTVTQKLYTFGRYTMKRQRIFAGVLALGLLLALVAGGTLAQEPQEDLASQDTASTLLGTSLGTAFTYQGRLMDDSGNPLTGSYDFQFELYDAESDGGQVGSTVTVGDVAVSDGLFTVQLDFGSSAFTGNARWLEIGVRAGSSSGAYTILAPRQPLTATPYALSLRPGAKVTGNTGLVPALSAKNTNSAAGYGLAGTMDGNIVGAGGLGMATASSGEVHGVWGESDSANGCGGYFKNTGGGADIMAAGSGIIKSNADSVLYLSPHDMVVRGSSDVTLAFLDDGSVDIHSTTTGAKYLSIPVSTFGTLFGSPVYVKSIEVCYHRVGGGYIDVTVVTKNDGSDGGHTHYIYNTANRTSETHACYTVTESSPKVIDNSTWVQFNVNGGDHVLIHTVKLTLTETP